MHYVIESLVQRGTSSWRASFRPIFDDGGRGERVFTTITDCANRRAAKCAAEEERARLEEIARAEIVDEADTPTLMEFQDAWVQDLVATGAISDQTGSGYVSGVRSFGEIAYMRMGEVSEHDIRESIQAMLEDGFSPNTVARGLSLVRNAFARAVKAKIIQANPCDDVKPPKRVATRPRSLSSDERMFLLSILPMVSGPMPLAIRMALSTGVRGEEVRGFTWSDWDEGGATLSVRRVVVRNKVGAVEVKQPKTPSSLRTLPVEPMLQKALSERKQWQMRLCTEFGVPFSKGFYILGEIDGKPYTPDALQRDFAALCKAFGIECCFHWLRHTFATGMIARGVNIRTVAQWLGHADPGFTLRIYVDADQDALVDSLSVVSGLVEVPDTYRPPLEIDTCLSA